MLAMSSENRQRPSSSPSGARCAETAGCDPGRGRPRCETRVLDREHCGAAGRTAISLESRRPDSLARIRPPEAPLRPWSLSLALPEVGDIRKERDRTHARTRPAPSTSDRSRIAFSRRTSRKGRAK